MTAPTLEPAGPAFGRPTGVRRLPPPALAPPYDDERWPHPAGPDAYGQTAASALPRVPEQHGALALALPFPAPSPEVPRLRLAPPAEPTATTATMPPPAVWSARFVRVLLEAMAGLRPVSQLGSWADTHVCRRIARRIRTADGCRDLRRSTGRVRSLHVSTPAPRVAEVCAIVEFGDRIRAVALRAEARDVRWRCTELTIG